MAGGRRLPLFLCGALAEPRVAAAVFGAPMPAGANARLADHALVWSPRPGRGVPAGHPGLVPRAGRAVAGRLVDPGPGPAARHAAFAAICGARLAECRVETATGPVPAIVALPEAAPGGPPQDGPLQNWTPQDWTPEAWAAPWAAILADAAEAVLSVADRTPLAALRLRYPMALARAASRLRAGTTTGGPARLRHRPVQEPGREDVATLALDRPYQGYFAVEEAALRPRRFDDAPGPVVHRAVFVMADAVAVLPYDPARDRVLLIEQFRPGPHLRGDPNPWSLEAIAGRIDPGESAADAARREAVEESGLALGEMRALPGHYPSPGAVTEFIEGFIGLADLPDSVAGLGGLAVEDEDIRSHVVPFDALMALLESGEIGNGPLQILALWLARLRPEVRALAAGPEMPRA